MTDETIQLLILLSGIVLLVGAFVYPIYFFLYKNKCEEHKATLNKELDKAGKETQG